MIHPIFKTLATQPELLAEHAGAYAELAAVEAAAFSERLQRRVLLWVLVVVAGALALGFAGVALMLWATTRPEEMRWAWLLVSVPALPALVAAVCLWLLQRMQSASVFAGLREQWIADRAMWRAVSEGASR